MSAPRSRRRPQTMSAPGGGRQPTMITVDRAIAVALSKQGVNGGGDVGQRRGVVKASNRLAVLVIQDCGKEWGGGAQDGKK